MHTRDGREDLGHDEELHASIDVFGATHPGQDTSGQRGSVLRRVAAQVDAGSADEPRGPEPDSRDYTARPPTCSSSPTASAASAAASWPAARRWRRWRSTSARRSAATTTSTSTRSTSSWLSSRTPSMRSHEQVRRQYASDGRGPATTLTMVALVWPRAYVVHVGDSRAYYLRGGRLRQLTRDQTAYEELVDQGVISAAGRRRASGRLEEHADERGRRRDEPSIGLIDLEAGDALLLCTDGLTKHVRRRGDRRRSWGRAAAPRSRCRRLDRPDAGARRERQRDGRSWAVSRPPESGCAVKRSLAAAEKGTVAWARCRARRPAEKEARTAAGGCGARRRRRDARRRQPRPGERDPLRRAEPRRREADRAARGGAPQAGRRDARRAQAGDRDARGLRAHARSTRSTSDCAARSPSADKGDDQLSAKAEESAKALRREVANSTSDRPPRSASCASTLLDQTKRLDEEIQRRSDDLAAALARAVEELRSEKADRKAVAGILHEVAMRLTDEFALPLGDGQGAVGP